MPKLQDSVFSIVKTSGLSPAVFSFLQPTDEFADKTPLGGILKDTNYGWLALGPKLCVVDVKTGLKVAAWTFGGNNSSLQTSVTSVAEIPTPLTSQSRQLVVSLDCDGLSGQICIFHVNGSYILRCIQTEEVIVKLAVCENTPEGPLACFDGVVLGGTKSGEVIAFDLNRTSLIQALSDLTQGNDGQVRNEFNMTNLIFLPLASISDIEDQREIAIDNDDHIAIFLNENCMCDSQYIFYNPDGSVRMKALRAHVRVSSVQYIPQLASLAVGFNFGAFQIWNLMTLELEYTSQVNVECLPVTHFGFQEPCDDPRAFCYLWVVYSVIDRFDDEGFPFAVMYSLTYQGKRMLPNNKYLYQEFLSSNVRFQVELSSLKNTEPLVGGRCISCHTYSIDSTLGEEGEDSLLNLCQLVWECWGEDSDVATQYGHLLFDLDQWYKDQMPGTYQLKSNAFMSATTCMEASRDECCMLDVRVMTSSVTPYSHATRLEEHFYPNSLQYKCICLSTSDCTWVRTSGVQRDVIARMTSLGPSVLLNPRTLYEECTSAGLTPLYHMPYNTTLEDKRRYLLSVALEARLISFLRNCAHDWATGALEGSGCTLLFMVDWCWRRALELKQNAKELTAPLFTSTSLPDRNLVRCLENCVRQLNELSGLLDSILTKCCNLVVPDVLSELEEKFKGVGTVALYFQMVQWFLSVGLLPERQERHNDLPYPGESLREFYENRRIKLSRLQDGSCQDEAAANKGCPLLYIDQLIEHECGGELVHNIWRKGGSPTGLYPPPSLYCLLRLYLLPEIAEEHKHSLILYLLVDYSMIYDDIRYEEVIRRLMQFPTMFGLSNTTIKATQAFWHLDHRDFDFALDQLQCLTGNTLSEWQHHVVLSALLAQKKTQAALQYLHVRKPAPIQNKDSAIETKLSDWQSSCNLYLARGLVYEALDVVRMCANSVTDVESQFTVMNHLFKGLHNTGQLSKLLQVTLTSFEEDAFIKYLDGCNESQTSDILIMFYLQQARYIEAQQYNNKLKHVRTRLKDTGGRTEEDRESGMRGEVCDVVDVICGAVPAITGKIAHCVFHEFQTHPHVGTPRPMSALIQAKSPKNKFTFKSSLIQDTIENASDTWKNEPKCRPGLKRSMNVEETPFICTPKFNGSRKSFLDAEFHSTPKRVKLDMSYHTPKTPRALQPELNISAQLKSEIDALLEMPDVQTPPQWKLDLEDRRLREATPQSILKVRRSGAFDCESAPSPVDSHYLGESDDELLETASRHSHLSDSTNRHLRFTIPTASESGSTPSPTAVVPAASERSIHDEVGEKDTLSEDTAKHSMAESSIFESPPKKLALEAESKIKKSLKDNVRGRRSLTLSANSSLSDDPNASIESIADIPITLINPRYERRQTFTGKTKLAKSDSVERSKVLVTPEKNEDTEEGDKISPIKSLSGRKPIRLVQSTPIAEISKTERQDSPTVKRASIRRLRSRSRTPDKNSENSLRLEPISELPKLETEFKPKLVKSVYVPQRTLRLRSRSRTPDRLEKSPMESPRLEPITESPTKTDQAEELVSPIRRSLRSRSRTPDVEKTEQVPVPPSPKTLRSKSKTPDRELMSPKVERAAKAKPLSRIVLEANTFKSKQETEKIKQITQTEADSMECTPKKNPQSILELDISPIDNKSILKTPIESPSEALEMPDNTSYKLKSFHLPNISEIFSKTMYDKSVLNSYDSSIDSSNTSKVSTKSEVCVQVKASDTQTLQDYSPNEVSSALRDMSSLLTSDSDVDMTEVKEATSIEGTVKDAVREEVSKAKHDLLEDDDRSSEQSVKRRIIEIEQEIHDLEGSISGDGGDDSVGNNTEDSDDDQIDDEQTDEQSEDEVDEEEGTDDEESSDGVISIADSSEEQASDTSGSENRLQIDDDTNSQQPIENMQTDTDSKQSKSCEEENTVQSQFSEGSTDPLNQANVSLMTDDNSGLISDRSELSFGQSKDIHDKENTGEDKKQELASFLIVSLPPTSEEKTQPTVAVDVVDAAAPKSSSNDSKETREETKPSSEDYLKPLEDEKNEPEDIKKVQEISSKVSKNTSNVSENISNVSEDKINEDNSNTKIPGQDKKTPEDSKKSSRNIQKRSDSVIQKESIPTSEKPSVVGQKSGNNTSIGKNNESEISEPRKRTRSSSMNKSDTDVDVSVRARTPTRGRSKTPNTEVRTILTRRASKELSDITSLDESVGKEANVSATAPKTRVTRSRSKSTDDSTIVANESSGTIKEKSSETKRALPIRGKRKSILATKPELTVIPEIASEETSTEGGEQLSLINEISKTRRLTRHQKNTLETWLGASASKSSIEETPQKQKSFETPVKHNRESPDTLNRSSLSSESITSDVSFQRRKRTRLTRAASESRSMLHTPPRTSRRASVDVVNTSEIESPGRARRASFNKACEALSTPKARRLSTDIKKSETDSGQSTPVGSESDSVAATPARRTRRTSSTHSHSSTTRSKK